VLAAIGLVLAVLTVAFNLILGSRLGAEATGVVQARAAAELATLRVTGGRIVVAEAPDAGNPDTEVWVFAGAGAIERPRIAPTIDQAAATLARAAPATRDVPGAHTRLYSLPVAQSRHLGAVVAGVSLAPYEQTAQTALVASAVLALAVLLAVAIAARWLISRALRPVARMTSQAADWSEHDLDRRFALGPPHDELMALADTLDGLLDRVAASMRHEQRLSAELSHELRTPLTSISAEAQYALRHTDQPPDGREALEHILQSTGQMGRTLDTLIAAARAQLDPHRATSDAAACARAAAATCARAGAGERPAVSVHAPGGPVRVAVEQNLVERILAPLVENACRYATHEVRVVIDRDGTSVRFSVQDDGPGVPADAREAIFEPGPRAGLAPTATIPSQGAGLGLALSRRLARTAGGEVVAGPSDAGGRFIARLPAHSTGR
jgi:signal transduction histidine kinase